MVPNKRAKQFAQPKAYSGTLSFSEDEGEVEMIRFIIRADEVAFHLQMEWDLGGLWEFVGVARRVEADRFVAVNQLGAEIVGNKKVPDSESIPISFSFQILNQSEKAVRVSARFSAMGETHPFVGRLSRFEPARTGKK